MCAWHPIIGLIFMTSGRWIRYAVRGATLVALLLAGATTSAATQEQIESIILGIDTPRDRPIYFVERRTNRLLTKPLTLKGNIRFSADGTLSKKIEEPFQERVTISARHVELERKDKIKRLALDRRPDVKAFYVGIQALLDGDAATLLESFDVTLTERGDRWSLNLTPREKKLRKFVAHMVISGIASQVRMVRTEQPDGNWQEMSFHIAAD